MMIVAGDYIVNTFEGIEQYAKPHRLVTHPLYNRSTNNADIMLIKVLQILNIQNVLINARSKNFARATVCLFVL